MKKTKAMLLKEFNRIQKDYLKAVREGRVKEAQEIFDARLALRESLRKVDKSYDKRK